MQRRVDDAAWRGQRRVDKYEEFLDACAALAGLRKEGIERLDSLGGLTVAEADGKLLEGHFANQAILGQSEQAVLEGFGDARALEAQIGQRQTFQRPLLAGDRGEAEGEQSQRRYRHDEDVNEDAPSPEKGRPQRIRHRRLRLRSRALRPIMPAESGHQPTP